MRIERPVWTGLGYLAQIVLVVKSCFETGLATTGVTGRYGYLRSHHSLCVPRNALNNWINGVESHFGLIWVFCRLVGERVNIVNKVKTLVS